jgi:hypothetical protein
MLNNPDVIRALMPGALILAGMVCFAIGSFAPNLDAATRSSALAGASGAFTGAAGLSVPGSRNNGTPSVANTSGDVNVELNDKENNPQ